MTSKNNPATQKTPFRRLPGSGRIAARFRNINIILFLLAFFIMTAVMLAAFNDVIRTISSDYARRYAASSAEALSAHISKELDLMAKVAHSSAVIEWMADEENNEKKLLAHEEMSDIISLLYSNNLYIGLERTRHEYKVEKGYTVENIKPFTVLDKNNKDDAWYFEVIESDKDYTLSVDIDRVLQKKRLWIDYKVFKDGVTLGLICTGLEFSHVVQELFSQYGKHDMRGFIIDEKGIINMDSSLMEKKEFSDHDSRVRIEEVISDPVFLAAIQSHLGGINGYFKGAIEAEVIRSPSGQYRYMTIAPIRFTNWSAVILYDSSSLLNMSLFIPVSAIMLALLIGFALATNAVGYRLIFLPLGKLERSLARLKENKGEQVYGIERNDELGSLAHTIQDLFTKANRDALTGIYNRRFMENSLQHAMALLSRSNSFMSVFMLDVDFFKKYNDTYGHEQGDVCLKAVAQVLAGSITRANDFVARYGGEEFAVVLPNTDAAGARMIAEKLLNNVRDLKMDHAESIAAPYVTVSIGVATGQVMHMQRWEDYLKRADEALYMSKQNGRDRYTHLDFTDRLEQT
ncbi:MAG: GGDEF domain-containing protein [Betaproteobacteria bacterium]|nr:GGDEF domain-containing protein [Betaproteobacteria bacterium]